MCITGKLYIKEDKIQKIRMSFSRISSSFIYLISCTSSANQFKVLDKVGEQRTKSRKSSEVGVNT